MCSKCFELAFFSVNFPHIRKNILSFQYILLIHFLTEKILFKDPNVAATEKSEYVALLIGLNECLLPLLKNKWNFLFKLF